MSSLQDQLLKAGLADKKKLKQASKAKKKEQNRQRHAGELPQEDAKDQARRALAEKAERSRELAMAQNAEAEQKAIAAQIRQLVMLNRLSRDGAELPFNFTDGKLIKKLFVTSTMQVHLASGKLAIVKLENRYEIVPAQVADKISQRDQDAVLLRHDASQSEDDQDDPYAEYKIPDDLMW
jgi:uncharacterized protein YaiL (DUF2058 family)